MKSEQLDAKSIFAEALDCADSKKRAEYLDEACGNNETLREEVESLLKSYEQVGGLLPSPEVDAAVTMDSPYMLEGPGTVIGRYKLLEKIGEGGMAVVYMAEQKKPIRRKVALKIIKLGMDTKQVIARFEAERQALAMMDHPNIAKVLDAGSTDTGRPYFVMELVRGVSITEYCDKNDARTQERLELFITVCNAVQHAHQKGIIHRDIKPSNVMVTLDASEPMVKVIDFGIAKATNQQLTEKTVFTRYAQMIGTPTYMSPEQAEMSVLDIDTRTDIYSLGVLLYELLTGTTPFDAEKLNQAGYGEIQRIIREEEPPKPSTKLSTMGEKLTIVAKHRHSNPELLTKLIRGDLDWIAIKSLEKNRTRRYESANELALDIQRHLNNEPVVASPPSRIYRLRKFVRRNQTTVAVGLIVFGSLVIGLVVATFGFVQASHERDRAEFNFQKAREAVDRMLTQVAEELTHLPGMPKKSDSPEVNRIKQALLEDALEYYEDFLAERSSDHLVRYETANAYLRVGDITFMMEQYKRSEETYLAASKLLEKLVVEFPGEYNYLRDLAESYNGRAEVMWYTDRRKEAENVYQKAMENCSKAIGLKPDESHNWYMRAMAYWGMGDLQKAIADFSKAIELDPDNSRYWQMRANIYFGMGNLDKVIAGYSKAIELDPEAENGHYWHMRGAAYLDAGQFENAIADYTQAIKLYPEAYEGHYWSQRGKAYLKLGEPNKAIADFSKAIQLQPENDNHWHMRGAAYWKLGDLDKVIADYSKGIELEQGNSHYWHMRGTAYLKLGEPNKAVADYTQAIKLNPEAEEGHYWSQRGAAYLELGEPDKAIADYSKAIKLDPNNAIVFYRRALAHLGVPDTKGYRKSCESMLEHFAQTEKPDEARWVAWTCALEPNAIEDLDKIVELAELSVERGSKTVQNLNALGAALYRAGRFDEALKQLSQLTAKWEQGKKLPIYTSPTYTWFFLAMAHHQLGDVDAARRYFDLAVKRMEEEMTSDVPWNRKLTLRLLQSEAQSLLGVSQKIPPNE